MKTMGLASLLAISSFAMACGDSAEKADAAGFIDAGVDAAAPPDAGPVASIVRGQYIVDHLAACTACHTPRQKDGSPDPARYLAGVDCFIDIDPDTSVGCLSSRNLTNHATGLMTRTDAQIKNMFQNGKRPDDSNLVPVMPYYLFHNMTDVDADSVVLYLRTVAGVDHTVAPNQVPFTPPAQAAVPLDPVNDIPQPTVDNAETQRGRYLASMVGLCIECHTPRVGGDFGTFDKTKWFAGGEAFPAAALGLPTPPFPTLIVVKNITPHATGIAGYTQADVVKVLKMGLDKSGGPVCPPMPAGPMGEYAGLTDQDANDIAAYILALPPIDHAITAEQCPLPPP